MKRQLCLLIALYAMSLTLAMAQAPPETHYLKLLTNRDTGEVIAIVGDRRFTTVETLKNYFAESLPRGSTIIWREADDPPVRWKKFTDSWDEIKKLCSEKGIKFVVAPPGFW